MGYPALRSVPLRSARVGVASVPRGRAARRASACALNGLRAALLGDRVQALAQIVRVTRKVVEARQL